LGGRQPTILERNTFLGWFPSLVNCEWSITAESNPTYNCIAWSVGETNIWYAEIGNIPPNVVGIDETYGNNDGIFEISDMDAFYDAKGYTPTGTGPSDSDIMYYSGYHGARKKTGTCGAGEWVMYESKCGQSLRIEHVYNQLNGASYGSPIRYYKHK
jgi:hypothetical protein